MVLPHQQMEANVALATRGPSANVAFATVGVTFSTCELPWAPTHSRVIAALLVASADVAGAPKKLHATARYEPQLACFSTRELPCAPTH